MSDTKNKSGEFKFKFNKTDNFRTITITEYLGESKKIIVPASVCGIQVTNIGDHAFSSCNKLNGIELPEGLVSIGEYAFACCNKLSGINFPENLVSIGDSAFFDCKQIGNIILPKGTTDIGTDVFSSCDSLSEIVVDEQNPVYASNDGVLFDKNMTTLIKCPQGKKGDFTVPGSVVAIQSDAFLYCCELTRITLPHDFIFTSTRHDIFHCCEQLTEIIVNENNFMFRSIDGVLFTKAEKKLLRYPQGRKNPDYIVPDETLSIGHNAFSDCKWLTNITLPEKLKIIEYAAFERCEQLVEIILPLNLQYIDENAFIGCSHLKTIKLSRKTKVGYKPFREFSGQIVYLD
jgi:hypothetical protein